MVSVLFVSLFLVIPVVALSLGVSQVNRRNQAFASFAAQSEGRFLPPSIFSMPQVDLEHMGLKVQLKQVSSGGKHPIYWVELTAPLAARNQRGLRMEVYPAGMLSNIGVYLGMQDLEIGAPDFDARYILKSNDHAWLTDALDGPLQDAIDELYDLWSSRDVWVQVNRDQLKIRVQRLVESSSDLGRFWAVSHRVVAMLLERLMPRRLPPARATPGIRFLPEDDGIEFLEQADDVLVDPGEVVAPGSALPPNACQVCGGAVLAAPAICAVCDTLHHPDCWDLTGRCGTFGCRSNRTRRA